MPNHASRIFEHLSQLRPEDYAADPVSTVLCVVRRCVGKMAGCRSKLNRMVRHDGAYLAFDLPDGSILMVRRVLDSVQQDQAGNAWPWVMAVPDRGKWERIVATGSSPEFFLNDCFCMQIHDEEAGSWAA